MRARIIGFFLQRNPIVAATTIGGAYLAFSMIIIFSGDRFLLISSLADNAAELTKYQSVKAVFYLLITGLLLFFLTYTFFHWLKSYQSGQYRQFDKLQKIISSTMDGILIINRNEQIDFINEKGAEMLGYLPSELLNRNFACLLGEEKQSGYFHKALTEGKSLVRLSLKRKDDSKLYTGISLSRFNEMDSNDCILLVIRDLTEVKTYEEKLKANEAKYQKMVDLSPLGIIITRKEEVQFLNRAAINIFGGKNMRDFTGRSFFHFVEKEYHKKLKLRQEVFLTENINLPFTRIKCRKIDGTLIDVETAAASFEINGKIYIEAIIRDITNDLEKDKHIRDNEERLRFALDSANQGLYDLNVKTGKAVVSDIYAKMIGYDSPDELMETNDKWLNRLHPDDRPVIEKAYSDYISGKSENYSVEFRQLTKEGRWMWILSLGKIVEYDIKGEPVRMLGTHTDITSIKEAEEAVRKSEGKFREAIMSFPYPVMIHAEDGEIIQVNHAWCEISGYLPSEIPDIHSWVNKAFPGNQESVLKVIKTTYSLKTSIDEGRFTVNCKNGRSRIWHFSSAPLKNTGDDKRQVLSTAIDVTEKVAVEDELKHYREELEKRIIERTSELEEKNRELSRINQLFVGREFRIHELKEEIRKFKTGTE